MIGENDTIEDGEIWSPKKRKIRNMKSRKQAQNAYQSGQSQNFCDGMAERQEIETDKLTTIDTQPNDPSLPPEWCKKKSPKNNKRKRRKPLLDMAECSKMRKMLPTSSNSLNESSGLYCGQTFSEDAPTTVMRQEAGCDTTEILQGFGADNLKSKASQNSVSNIALPQAHDRWFGGYSDDSANSQSAQATRTEKITMKIELSPKPSSSENVPSITRNSSTDYNSTMKRPFEFERGQQPTPCCGYPGDVEQQYSAQVNCGQPTFWTQGVQNEQPRAPFGVLFRWIDHGKPYSQPKCDPEKTNDEGHPRTVDELPTAFGSTRNGNQRKQYQKQEEAPHIGRQANVDYKSKKIPAFGRTKSASKTVFLPPPPICTCCDAHDLIGHEKQHSSTERLTKSAVQWFIDSHCHLDFIYYTLESETDKKGNRYYHRTLKDFEKRWPKSFRSNFYGCIANYVDPRYFVPELNSDDYDAALLRDQMADDKVVACTIGCHPHLAQHYNSIVHQSIRNVAHFSTQSRNRLKAAASKCDDGVVTDYMKNKTSCKVHGPVWKFAAIGEIGLDFHKMRSERELQIDVLNQQLDIAAEFQMPVVIHCRSAVGDDEAEELCIKLMQKKLNRFWSVHRHCFIGSMKVAQMWLDAFPNTVFGLTPLRVDGRWWRTLLEALPLSSIVLETDAPYFSPHSMREHLPSNSSLPGAAHVVAEKLAEVKGTPLDEVLRVVRGNTIRMYDLFRFVAPEVAK